MNSLVGAAKTALRMAFEMGERHHGIVMDEMAPHRHPLEPFPAFDREGKGVFFVDDIDRGEGPSVHLKGLAVGFGRVSVPFVIGVRFDDGRIRKIFFKQRLHPFAGNDVGPMLFAGMELYPHLSADLAVYLLIGRNQPFRR